MVRTFLCVVVLAGCTRAGQVDQWYGDGDAGGAPTTGEEEDLWTTPPGDEGSCCGAADFALFTEGDAACPKGTTEGFTAHADLAQPDPHTCTECSCSPAACTLPEGILTFPATCAGADGSIPLPFGPDPGSGWDGSCSQANAHPANQLCDGVLCIQSLLIPATTAAPCAASTPVPSKPDWTWGRTVRQCRLSQQGCDVGQVRVPSVVPDGFELCRWAKGDVACPPGYYSEPSVLYMGASDERDCEDCDCGAPQGAQCKTYLSVYEDSACSSPITQNMVSTATLCVDVTPGSALGSTDAWVVTDVPGSCTPSGGDPVGDLEPADPVTLCCPKVAK